jgi:hypothetical protein
MTIYLNFNADTDGVQRIDIKLMAIALPASWLRIGVVDRVRVTL